MGVLIRGMEMPKSCRKCCLCDFDREGYYCIKLERVLDKWHVRTQRDCDCPLVEVSVPHKDLVDRDTLMQEVEKYIIKPDTVTKNTWNECVKTIMYEIKNAHAIIEEEDV